MGSSDANRDHIQRVFSELEEPHTPLTASEVAGIVGCSEQVARETLETLSTRGNLRTRNVTDQLQVWWMGEESEYDSHKPETEEYGAFVSAVKDYAIFRLDPNGIVSSWNEGAERIKGYQEGEIVGEHFSTFYTESDVNEGVPEQNLETALQEGRVEDEGWRVRKDGSTFWANVTITAIRDDDGTLRGFTKVTRDMTEQREYEQQLRAERDFIEQILETVPVSVCVVNADGEIVQANDRVLDRLGIDGSDFANFGVASWEIYDEKGRPISLDNWPWTRVLETGEPMHGFECQVDVPEEGRRWLSINAALLENGESEDDRVVFSVSDITDRKERERQLRRERDQTEKLLRTAPIPIAVRNSDAETILANRRAQEALGVSEQELLTDPKDADEWDLYDANGDPLAPEKTPSARVLATGEPVFNEEISIQPPNGDRMHFHINSAPVFDSEGEVERVITAGEDITELKQRERLLEQRKTELETELSEILGRISDAFYALDDEWRFTHLNDQASELLQRPKDELLGEVAWEEFIDVSAVYRENFVQAMETQEPVTFEVYNDDLNDWLEFNVYPSESGVSVYFREITARKEQEQALRERERRLNRYKEYTDDILDSVDDIFYLLNKDGELQRWNESLCSVTGYSDAEVPSMHAIDFFAESQREKIVDAVAEGFETGDVQIEAEVSTKNQDRIPYEFVASRLEDPNGKPVLAGIGRDITARRKYARKLEASNERLEQFAYAASHDLQEPLRMISSYLQLIERRYANELDEDGREFIEFAVDGAQRMRDMIDGLLEYSRVDTRGDPFEPVDLNEVLADVRNDLQMLIEESDAEIRAESLPRVEGDPGQLRQVFQNLADNAIEYSGDEPPQVRITAERDRDMWAISVHDEGIGIDPEDADRVFEVFQSLESPADHSGTGIGLAICDRIVERHGGDIWVETTPGTGTTVTFTLPYSDVQDE